MTTKGKKVAIGSLVLVAGLFLTAALSFGHGMRSGGDGVGPYGPFPERMMDRLGVAGEQKTRIDGVLGKFRPEAEPLVQQVVTERRTLRRLVQDGAADEKTIRSQAAKLAALETDLAVLRARVSKEVRSLLTADQIARLEEFRAQREKKADRIMEHGEHGRRGSPMEKR
jgi:Spy/CpxP family protein refolding chaperone